MLLDAQMRKHISANGAEIVTDRGTLNFIGDGVVAVDNPAMDRTDVTVNAGVPIGLVIAISQGNILP